MTDPYGGASASLSVSLSSSSNSSSNDTDDDQAIARMSSKEEEYRKNHGTLGKMLSHLDSIPHTPRVNGKMPDVNDATLDHERLSERLVTYDLAELQIEGDGNCQFRALADQLFHKPEYHKHTRKEVVKQLKHNRRLYEGYVPMKYKSYLKIMKRLGEWGDHLTLQATADRFSAKICLVTSFRDTYYIEIIPKDKDPSRDCLFLLDNSELESRCIINKSFSVHELGVIHVLVTGGAGYIGSHASLQLLKNSYRVTIVDNLSRGNMGAVKVLQELFPEPGRLQFIYADLGDAKVVNKIFAENAFDAVMHFAAVAYVGESTAEPLRYYHNITSNTLVVLKAMASHDVKTLIYSSTCATYGEPKIMPITEDTPQAPINPYGKAKKMSEDIILDFSKTSNMAVMILRYFNVIGSDPEGRLGEGPPPELREQGRISGACFDAARGIIPGLKIRGTDYSTADGTCVRDYIDVTDLVDAHVKAIAHARPSKVGIYNVGTGKGSSVKQFVEACKKATGVAIKIEYLSRRPGDYAEVYSDPSKIRRELNWIARYTNLEESLKTAWRWQRSHKNGYGSHMKSGL